MKKKLFALLLLVPFALAMLGAETKELSHTLAMRRAELSIQQTASKLRKEQFNDSIFYISSQCSKTSSILADNDETVDYVGAAFGNIQYREGEYRTAKNDNRPIVDAGMYSAKKTFDIGCGCGLTDDNLWYITFTFNEKTSEKTIMYNMLALIVGTARVTYLGEDSQEIASIAQELMQYLLNSEDDIAIELNEEIVLFKKDIGGGRLVVGVDSVEFYDLFYKGTIEDYYSFDLTA